MMKLEKFLVPIAILALISKLMHYPGSGLLLIISFLSLAAFYFYASLTYQLFPKQDPNSKYGLLLATGYTLATILIGILFKLMFWPSSNMLLMIGSISICIQLYLIISYRSSMPLETKGNTNKLLTRIIVFAIASWFFYLTPQSSIILLSYSHDPELGRLKKQLYEDPNNEAFKQELEDYELKGLNEELKHK